MPKPNVTVELFSADNWCGYCIKFKPEWEKFQSMTKDNEYITTAHYDEANKKEMDKVTTDKGYHIDGFPTLIITINDNSPIYYKGERTADTILGFIQQEMKEPQSGGKKSQDKYEQKYYKYKAKYLKSKSRNL